MFRFLIDNEKLLVNYAPISGVQWIFDAIKKHGDCVIKNTFFITNEALIGSDDDSDYDADEIMFVLGVKEGNYIKLDKKVLKTDNNIYFDIDIVLNINYFIAYRNISILSHLSGIVKEELYVDSDNRYQEIDNHISLSTYKVLIDNFPNSTELTKYADYRISLLLNEYFDGLSKYKINYDRYLAKKQTLSCSNEIADINEIKLNLLLSARETLQDMLDNFTIYGEKDWQEKIKNIICILFPKYLYCLREINIGEVDGFDKQPDYVLIDSNGYIDLMEIKKPDSNQVMRNAQVRNNYVPQKIFTDVAVQTSKYIFTINKNYHLAKKNIAQKLSSEYPNIGISEECLHINNPKGIILFGRSDKLNQKQLSDFELIRRQYKDIPEIMTYDDLLKRLDNLIQSLSR